MTVLVEEAALLMTVQDWGRHGYQRYGMPESGPMDWWAFRSANHLVGNQPDCACLEMGFSTAELVVGSEALMAVCGAGFQVYLNDNPAPLWMAFMAKQGDRLRFEKVLGGNWVYLAVSGGIQSSAWMGSRSVYPRAGLGMSLIVGDSLPLAACTAQARLLAGRSLPVSAQPAYQQDSYIGVIPGPHQERFTDRSVEVFFGQPFTLSTRSDRMGYRLLGPALSHQDGADIISQGMVTGQIQVPADGQPIVMMPDHPTTGGYTCLGTVAKVSLPLLAQTQPGEAQLRFHRIEVGDAQKALGEALQAIESAIIEEEDPWLFL